MSEHAHEHGALHPQWSKYTAVTGILQLSDPDLAEGICFCRDAVYERVHFFNIIVGFCVAEVLASLLCLAITGSGTLSGRYPQRRPGEKWACPTSRWEAEERVWHGGELVLLLIAVCPIPPSMRKISLPLLVTKSFPSLCSTAGMNHPLSPSSALFPVVRLVSHLSLLQRLLKVHQDLLLHKSFTARLFTLLHFISTVFVTVALREKFPSFSEITLVYQTCRCSEKQEEKETQNEMRGHKSKHAEWQEKVTYPTDHPSAGCYIEKQAVTAQSPQTGPITGKCWPLFSLIGQNKRKRYWHQVSH